MNNRIPNPKHPKHIASKFLKDKMSFFKSLGNEQQKKLLEEQFGIIVGMPTRSDRCDVYRELVRRQTKKEVNCILKVNESRKPLKTRIWNKITRKKLRI